MNMNSGQGFGQGRGRGRGAGQGRGLGDGSCRRAGFLGQGRGLGDGSCRQAGFSGQPGSPAGCLRDRLMGAFGRFCRGLVRRRRDGSSLASSRGAALSVENMGRELRKLSGR